MDKLLQSLGVVWPITRLEYILQLRGGGWLLLKGHNAVEDLLGFVLRYELDEAATDREVVIDNAVLKRGTFEHLAPKVYFAQGFANLGPWTLWLRMVLNYRIFLPYLAQIAVVANLEL